MKHLLELTQPKISSLVIMTILLPLRIRYPILPYGKYLEVVILIIGLLHMNLRLRPEGYMQMFVKFEN